MGLHDIFDNSLVEKKYKESKDGEYIVLFHEYGCWIEPRIIDKNNKKFHIGYRYVLIHSKHRNLLDILHKCGVVFNTKNEMLNIDSFIDTYDENEAYSEKAVA